MSYAAGRASKEGQSDDQAWSLGHEANHIERRNCGFIRSFPATGIEKNMRLRLGNIRKSHARGSYTLGTYDTDKLQVTDSLCDKLHVCVILQQDKATVVVEHVSDGEQRLTTRDLLVLAAGTGHVQMTPQRHVVFE